VHNFGLSEVPVRIDKEGIVIVGAAFRTVELGSDEISGGVDGVVEGGVDDVGFDQLEQVIALRQATVQVHHFPSPFAASVLQVAL
jgi:hypothetical protein